MEKNTIGVSDISDMLGLKYSRHIPKSLLNKIVADVFTTIKEQVRLGKAVRIYNFGRFSRRCFKGYKRHMPNGEVVESETRYRLWFTVSRKKKDYYDVQS